MSRTALAGGGVLLLALAGGLLSPATFARSGEGDRADNAVTSPGAADHVVVEHRAFKTEIERDGTLIPDDAATVSLWFEAYAGGLTLLEVAPHGAPVGEGDVIARIDDESLRDQLVQARLELESAVMRHRNALHQAEIDREGEGAAVDAARSALDRSRRALVAWEAHELKFRERQAAMSAQNTLDFIGDQEDELQQLEAMYRDDELVDATEEIVLRRSRRNLARSIVSKELQADRRKVQIDFDEKNETESRRQAVEQQEQSFKRMIQSHEVAERTRMDGIGRADHAVRQARDKVEDLEKDLALLTVRAPRSGVLLHGDPDDYRPGKVAPRYERGGSAAPRKTLFTVAQPDELGVALEVPESSFAKIRSGTGVTVHPSLAPATQYVGTLHVDRHPNPSSAGAPENTYAARVKLENPLPGYVVGMRCKVKIVTEEIANAVIVPESAVFGGASDPHCFVAGDGGSFARVKVSLGARKDNEVVVESGLEAGQKVLLCNPEK
jgi:RND family efflux transporter MFP subunit